MKTDQETIGSVLAIVGPTASGKSALSMALAEASAKKNQTIELISMDSALVYRGMDIGTAKPTLNERSQVAHHGIDICDPWETYSAAHFVKDTHQWIREIRARGNIPVIIGGTMLYWRALTQGLTDLPPANPEIRQEIEDTAKKLGWMAIYKQLMELDPTTANRLAPGDTQRVQRALEVVILTGKPMSSILAENPYGQSRDDTLIPHCLISLEPHDRSWLHERIARRFDQMIDAGFLGEMEKLMNNPKIYQDLPSMRAVGYRQAWEYLKKEVSFNTFNEKSIAATRQLGKRQLTWLRAMPSRQVIDPSRPEFIEEALQVCLNFLNQAN